MYMGETQENCVTCQNSWNPHLEIPFSVKDKRRCCQLGVWDFIRGGRQLT